MLGTVDKAGRVLALFTSGQAEWGVTEAARKLRMPKSTAHSLMAALAGAGLLVRTEDNRYRLGWRLLNLSRTLLDSSDILSHARPAVATVSGRYGVTVHVAILHDGEVTYLHKAEGRMAVPPRLAGTGRQLPAHGTALGKVLLAYGHADAVDELVATRGLPALTARTITSVDELRRDLALVRRRGWASTDEELVEGLCCYAAPIFGQEKRVEAAISVSVPTTADLTRPDRYARLALAAATSITRSLRTADTPWDGAAVPEPEPALAA